MNIVYIGGGFVGACSAAVSADSGHQVLVFDVDEKKVKQLGSNDRDTIESCLYEQGLGDLLVRNQERITFTTDYSQVEAFLDSADAVFLCLPTPEVGETGESNLSFYNLAIEQLAQALQKRNQTQQTQYIAVVNKSTVPIDTVDYAQKILSDHGVKNVSVVSNPEFLVEGKAIAGSLSPDRIVIGAWDEAGFALMRALYQRFYDSPSVQYIEVNPKEAAAGKLLANFVLFNRLAVCFDVVGRTCETFSDIQFEQVRRILTTEPRIGSWGFYDSLYAGGSCFIKDARSLAHQLQTAGANADLVNQVYLGNKRQLELFLSRAETEAKFDWAGKRVGVLGLAFKRDTNDVRNSPSIDIVRFCQEKNVDKITLYDPMAQNFFAQMFPASSIIQHAEQEFEAIENSDVIIIATDWPQFRGLADVIMTECKNRPLILDGRRMLQHRYSELRAAGFPVIAVGSPFDM